LQPNAYGRQALSAQHPTAQRPQPGTGLVIARPKGHKTQYAPLLEPVKKDMYGCRLGARRRSAGSRRGGRRQLAGATGTGRPNDRATRTTRSAERRRSHAGATRSARKAGLPVAHRRAPRAPRTPRSEHAVRIAVVTVVVVPEDYGAGKKDDRQDENDPGDNHNPRRGRVEPGRLGSRRRCRWWRGCGNGSRLGRGFGCFTHALNIAQAFNRRNGFRQQNCCESRRGSYRITRSPALGRAPGC
jgi:hypothetical protein